ncbi:hypothetical protein JN00_0127 [Metamycoplasma subdolum]|uniref:Uncharacterized protein n=1 Tax=Metamycoplasma subdolum TaxID=92407 RepID=A0A3M0A2N3_9BACT|nr:hypothetical protein [Metamycoplasma subdolum]RMA79080.1 hypothetical protein JN00_0127 [Metamycoplasma subdolum]WPB50603.1 hypothetical protein R9C05_00355 [Metamycoplasma subdolum]
MKIQNDPRQKLNIFTDGRKITIKNKNNVEGTYYVILETSLAKFNHKDSYYLVYDEENKLITPLKGKNIHKAGFLDIASNEEEYEELERVLKSFNDLCTVPSRDKSYDIIERFFEDLEKEEESEKADD